MSESILLIEDGDDQRELLEFVFKEAGLEVLAVPDAVQALGVLARWRPSAILLDWHLPLLSGASFVRSVRLSPELRWLPIIVLTGATEIEPEYVDAVLLKPLEVSEVIAVTRRLVHRTFPPAHEVRQSVGASRLKPERPTLRQRHRRVSFDGGAHFKPAFSTTAEELEAFWPALVAAMDPVCKGQAARLAPSSDRKTFLAAYLAIAPSHLVVGCASDAAAQL